MPSRKGWLKVGRKAEPKVVQKVVQKVERKAEQKVEPRARLKRKRALRSTSWHRAYLSKWFPKPRD